MPSIQDYINQLHYIKGDIDRLIAAFFIYYSQSFKFTSVSGHIDMVFVSIIISELHSSNAVRSSKECLMYHRYVLYRGGTYLYYEIRMSLTWHGLTVEMCMTFRVTYT